MKLALFAIVNLVAAMLSGAAGGGGGLVSLPLLVSLGLSPATAIATSKFGGFGIAAGSSLRFRHEKLVGRQTIIIFSIFGAIAAAAGSFTLVAVSKTNAPLQQIISGVILLVGIPLLYIRKLGIVPKQRSREVKIIGGILLFIVTVVLAAIGGGLGVIQFIILMSMFGMTALVATATRRAMQLSAGTVSLAIFMISGVVNYKYGIAGLITSSLGGFIGSHIAIKKGNRFVINLFALTSALLALQLLFKKL